MNEAAFLSSSPCKPLCILLNFPQIISLHTVILVSSHPMLHSILHCIPFSFLNSHRETNPGCSRQSRMFYFMPLNFGYSSTQWCQSKPPPSFPILEVAQLKWRFGSSSSSSNNGSTSNNNSISNNSNSSNSNNSISNKSNSNKNNIRSNSSSSNNIISSNNISSSNNNSNNSCSNTTTKTTYSLTIS